MRKIDMGFREFVERVLNEGKYDLDIVNNIESTLKKWNISNNITNNSKEYLVELGDVGFSINKTNGDIYSYDLDVSIYRGLQKDKEAEFISREFKKIYEYINSGGDEEEDAKIYTIDNPKGILISKIYNS